MGYVSASDVVWLKSSDSYHFSFLWLILGLWRSPLNYEGFTANASGKARFSGKIPQRSEDDFFRNHIGMTLPSERSICHFCPVVHRLANGMCICLVVILYFNFNKYNLLFLLDKCFLAEHKCVCKKFVITENHIL